ncbi:MAG: hypothetical protein H7Z12_14745 [Rhodospirillaceae bacterium]|nr:hypothetical protein [Rhodospirillales bacterium]
MLSRRQLLNVAVAAFVARVTSPAWAEEPRNVNAFNARSPESALGALGLPAAVETSLIEIIAPDVAENGANVPVEVMIRLPNVERILLIGERNVFPLLADIQVGPRAVPWFEVKVKMAETSHLRVYAVSNGELHTASHQVRVIVGGCLPG